MTNKTLRETLHDVVINSILMERDTPDIADKLMHTLRDYVPSEAMVEAWKRATYEDNASAATQCLIEWRAMISGAMGEG